jgi:hypothetical protein
LIDCCSGRRKSVLVIAMTLPFGRPAALWVVVSHSVNGPPAKLAGSGGYRLLHDFSARAGSEHFGTDCRPRMLRLTPADLPPGAMSMATQMFDPPALQLEIDLPAPRGLRPRPGGRDGRWRRRHARHRTAARGSPTRPSGNVMRMRSPVT